MATTSLALAPPPDARRPRVLLVGASLGAAASALVVLTLVIAYVQLRSSVIAEGETWLPEGTSLPLTPGSMGMTTLLMSGVMMAWCVYALRNRDRAHAYIALGLTAVLGVAYIADIVYLLSQIHIGVADSPQGLLLYVVPSAHIAMTAIGLLFALVMGFQALGGQLTGRDAEGMSAAALYWYVTIAVYSVIWYAVFITK